MCRRKGDDNVKSVVNYSQKEALSLSGDGSNRAPGATVRPQDLAAAMEKVSSLA